MNKFKDMSDLELNKLVAIATNLDVFEFINEMDQNKVYLRIGKEYTYGCPTWNPCNSITNAWNIILENDINLIIHQNTAMYSNSNSVIEYTDDNILRAAMIVYLIKKDIIDEN